MVNRWARLSFATSRSHTMPREVRYVPGFFKIIDEILVNAADNKVRGSFCGHI